MGITSEGILSGGGSGGGSGSSGTGLSGNDQAKLNALSIVNGELLVNGNPVDTTLKVLGSDTPFTISEKLLTFNIENLPEL